MAAGRWDQLLTIVLPFLALGALINLIGGSLLLHRGEAFAVLTEIGATRLLAGLFLAVAVPWITKTLRLWLWADFVGTRLRLGDAYRIEVATELAAVITPTAIGGAYVKIGLLTRRGVRGGTATSVMFMDTVEKVTFFALAIPLAVSVGDLSNTALTGRAVEHLTSRLDLIALVVLAVVGVGAVIRHTGWPDRPTLFRRASVAIARFARDALEAYRLIGSRGKMRFVATVTLYGIGTVCRYATLPMLLLTLGVTVNPLELGVLQWVALVGTGAVPTPGGAGAAEVGFFVGASSLLPASIAVVATGLWRLYTFYLPVIIGSVILGAAAAGAPVSRKSAVPRAEAATSDG